MSITYIFFLFSILATAAAAAAAPPYNPTDYFLVNCGSDSNTQAADGRTWEGDSNFSLPNNQLISNVSKPSDQPSSATQPPYTTARIFQHSPFTYTFPVSSGPKFLRLYFYPATYPGLQKSLSFFSVTAGGYTLLNNFSAFFTAAAIKQDKIVKEFVIEVRDNQQRLNITFSPSPNSYAFINGIEIVSVPANYYVRGSEHKIPNVGHLTPFSIDNNTALEVLYRFNVGGKDVGATNDSGMFRLWVQDDNYLLGGILGLTPHLDIPINYTSDTPEYSAPEIVYTTARTMNNNSLLYNMTWLFPVDCGFSYLLRLYFCEFQMEITLPGQRVFTIDINNQTAEEQFDVIEWSTGNKIPVYRDYVVLMSNESNKRDLWLSMRPNMKNKPQYANAILNGLEIFKLNGSDGSLAGPNPEPPIDPPTSPAFSTTLPDKGKGKSHLMIYSIIGGVIGGIAVFSILGFLVLRRRRRERGRDGTSVGKSSYDPITNTSRSTKTSGSSLPSGLCRRFSLAEIKFATGNFDDNFVIGTGGFGNVYKGYIDNGATVVAIKRLNSSSKQGVREFETEIELLSKLRHLHLVSLIGYCDENGEMALVYDYMSNGTLRDHLYKTEKSPLSWSQRLQICIGSARGLHYLHTGAKHTIIHRDVKSTNILLDEKFVAKVSDFGLSKVGPSDMSQTHVSTAVKGSFGYLDPEYYKRQQLTEKSDVYSFGVVLFEVLCGRPAIIPGLPREEVNLAEWARQSYRKGNLDKIIAPELKDEIAPECLNKFGEVAYSCVRGRGIDRPSMNDIVWNLEFALQLQESADKTEKVVDTSGKTVSSYGSINLTRDANTIAAATATAADDDDVHDHDVFSTSIEEVSIVKSSGSSNTLSTSSDKFKSESIFSEMMNAEGR